MVSGRVQAEVGMGWLKTCNFGHPVWSHTPLPESPILEQRVVSSILGRLLTQTLIEGQARQGKALQLVNSLPAAATAMCSYAVPRSGGSHGTGMHHPNACSSAT